MSENEVNTLVQELENDTLKMSIPYRRIRTDTMIQSDRVESGSVSLAIVLAYYEKHVPFDQILQACNVNREGSNIWNLVNAAERFGLEAYSYHIVAEELKFMTLPTILFWEFTTFVVFEGFNQKGFFINDPATGPRWISKEEFSSSYSGIAIDLKPSKSFVKSGEPTSLKQLLLKDIRDTKSALFYIFLTTIGLIIPALVIPASSQIFIDYIFSTENFSWGWNVLICIALATLFTGLLAYLQEKALTLLKLKLSLRKVREAIIHLLSLPLTIFLYYYPGTMANRVALVETIASLSANMLGLCLNAILIFFYAIVLFFYNSFIATAVVIAGLINIALFLYFYYNEDNFRKFQAVVAKNVSYSIGILDNIEAIKAAGLEDIFFKKWLGSQINKINISQSIKKRESALEILPQFLNSLIFLALVTIGGILLIQQKISPGVFVAIQILIANFMKPFFKLLDFSQELQLLKGSLLRFNLLMTQPTDIDIEAKNDLPPSHALKLKGFLELKDISFGYSTLDIPLFDKIHLKLEPGKVTGLVGKVGSGKTSLAMIAAGLLRPWSGAVLYDGISSEQLYPHQLSSSLGFVEQVPFIFEGTVKDNLTLLNPFVKESDIFKATKDACIHDEIMSLKGGYYYTLKNNGLNISAAWQLQLELARNLLKNPTILILDESTSGIDFIVEEKIFKNILQRGCSILLISHRLSSLQLCDEICLIDKGKISIRGTHEWLKAHSPEYRQLMGEPNK